jgi:putative restriction endonuclease
MPVSFANIKVGACYERKELARMWGYKSYQALGRGVVTPAGQNLIVLFVTIDKAAHETQYDDSFDGKTLRMDGEINHANDQRLANSNKVGDQVHLFCRRRHHESFRYCGKALLKDYGPQAVGRPSRFVFEVR